MLSNFDEQQFMNTLSEMKTDQLKEVLGYALGLRAASDCFGVVDKGVSVGVGHIPHQIND